MKSKPILKTLQTSEAERQTMKLDQAKSALQEHQNCFQEVVKQPNTIARNIVLAEHRNEIGRLEKLIAKSSQA